MPQTPFTALTAAGVPLDSANVDTDQVIPARFLKYPRSDTSWTFLFHDLRLRPDGSENPDFILSNEPYKSKGRILVADRNFGCGSSRESAVYALQDWGFRAVIAPSFGDRPPVSPASVSRPSRWNGVSGTRSRRSARSDTQSCR